MNKTSIGWLPRLFGLFVCYWSTSLLCWGRRDSEREREEDQAPTETGSDWLRFRFPRVLTKIGKGDGQKSEASIHEPLPGSNFWHSHTCYMLAPLCAIPLSASRQKVRLTSLGVPHVSDSPFSSPDFSDTFLLPCLSSLSPSF